MTINSDITLLIRDEVINLRKEITVKQAKKLSLKNRITENIYDQLTDNDSNEAIRLMNKCTKPYSSDLKKLIKPKLNKFLKNQEDAFSALEIFCYHATDIQMLCVHKYLQGNMSEKDFIKFVSLLKYKNYAK